MTLSEPLGTCPYALSMRAVDMTQPQNESPTEARADDGEPPQDEAARMIDTNKAPGATVMTARPCRRRRAVAVGRSPDTPSLLPPWAIAAAHRASSMLIALASAVFGLVAPGAVSSVHRLRRTAMAIYLAGCSLLVLGAVQVTPDGVGLAAVFLPLAVMAIVLAVGCHLRLRRQGSELVGPEA